MIIDFAEVGLDLQYLPGLSHECRSQCTFPGILVSMAEPFESVVLPSTTHGQFFDYLRPILNHAAKRSNDESLLYAAVNYILTSLSSTARRGPQNDTWLVSYPQKKIGAKKTSQIPDFVVLALSPRPQPITDDSQDVGQDFAEGKDSTTMLNFSENGVFIWEVKPAPLSVWSGPTPDELNTTFIKHLRQIRGQILSARQNYHQRPVYALLSVGVWFILIKSPGELQDRGLLSSFELGIGGAWKGFTCLFEPTPIFDQDWTDFTPEFLMALQMSLANLDYDTDAGFAPLFLASRRTFTTVGPNNISPIVAERVVEYIERLTIDISYAVGDESDSTQSTSTDSPFVSCAQPSQASPAATRSRRLRQAGAAGVSTSIHFRSHPIETIMVVVEMNTLSLTLGMTYE
ncbi:hypothetical protein AGABI1DRAFT_130209 [Agaricus bisporus var. burnettii JB137-S8]|uniref:Uncharacterized protein n=1 Tax=Agaricus bisporus var. burnettii (strain JB137-S8 / ATCC MYA-4627 / FGSC 10392) TaxID=597362 RepID=K5XRK0_AGABU|nr:uncharacterized protein AGABI1DRAFT_130209 [Agaricus bisporus var. burnettii JB137-S8]EKM77510.1 hypothetical protein AGABI1DRAFT_130209 [Agaricus bisporus var. burnettii JB137-S8]